MMRKVIVLFDDVDYGGCRRVVFDDEATPHCPFQLDPPPKSVIVAMGRSWALYTEHPSKGGEVQSVTGPEHEEGQVWYPSLDIVPCWLTNE